MILILDLDHVLSPLKGKMHLQARPDPIKLVSSPDRFFPFCLMIVEKGLVDLYRLFCSADSQILGVPSK